MKGLHAIGRGLVIQHLETTFGTSVVELPKFLQEPVHPGNTGRVPWLCLFQWPQEHLVHTEGISTVSLTDVIRIHHVVFGFGHLLYLSPYFKGAIVFVNELSLLKLGAPFSEGLHIQHISCTHQ